MPIIDSFFFVFSDLEVLSIFLVDLFFFCLLDKLACYVPVLKKTSQRNLLGHCISLLNINQS